MIDRKANAMTILFLDFDGVLHPHEVYMYHGRSSIELRAGPEHRLFEHAELLASLLLPFPEVSIVLSTSWCAAFRRFDAVKAYLPRALQKRVMGATWHSGKDRYRWSNMSRYDQINEYVARHQVENWLAVDDDDEQWPDALRDRLVHTHEWHGLGVEGTRQELLEKLTRLRDAGVAGGAAANEPRLLPGSCW